MMGIPESSDKVVSETRPPRRRSGIRFKIWTNIRTNWPIWLVAGITLLSGAVSVLQTLFVYHHPKPVTWVMPLAVQYWGRSFTLLFGFILIYLSLNLFRHRRVAWWLAVVISALLLMARFALLHTFYLSVFPAITLILLILFRKHFTVRSEPSSITRGLWLMALCLLIALLSGALGFWLLDKNDFGISFSFPDSIIRTLYQFTLIGNNDIVPHTIHARWFLDSLSALGVLAVAFAAFSLFRPVIYRLRVLPHENTFAKAILEQHGRSPYDFFKVWPDKSLFFSNSKKSFISYATVRGIALILGDPVGPDDEMEEIASSFIGYCSDNGWMVCFLMPDRISLYKSLSLDVLKIGEEAVVDLDHFCTHTSKTKYFRYHRNRFEKRGFGIKRYIPPHPPQLLEEMEDLTKEWLTLPKHRELGFLQGRFTRSYVEQTPLWVVRDSTGLAIAFINEVRSYRPGEATFDMMRHRPGVPNGTMDYLLHGMMLTLKQEGYESFNMGVAPFAGLGKSPDAPLTEKVLQLLFRINWFVSTKGMHYYKVKFEPQWNERFIAYQGGPVGLVRIALAVTRAVEGNQGSKTV